MPFKRMNMRKSLRFSAVFCLIGCIAGSVTFAGAAPKPGKKVSTSSVWQLPEQFMAGAHTACDKAAPAGFAECVIDQMAKAGVSADAVSFTRELYKQSSGDVGIMTGFQGCRPFRFRLDYLSFAHEYQLRSFAGQRKGPHRKRGEPGAT